MEKISYNLVFNRKKRLNKKGMALVQVEFRKEISLISRTGTGVSNGRIHATPI